MRVYLATKFENLKEFNEAKQMLEDLGHELTHDWSKEDASGKTGPELEAYLTGCALADLQGVRDAEALLIINHEKGKGMFVEMGAALAWQKPVFFVYPDRAYNIFTKVPGVEEFDDLTKAIDALHDYADLQNV